MVTHSFGLWPLAYLAGLVGIGDGISPSSFLYTFVGTLAWASRPERTLSMAIAVFTPGAAGAQVEVEGFVFPSIISPHLAQREGAASLRDVITKHKEWLAVGANRAVGGQLLIQNTMLDRVKWMHEDLQHLMFAGVRFVKCEFLDVSFSKGTFLDCSFVECEFTGCQFLDAYIERTIFTHCDLVASSFNGTRINNSAFYKCIGHTMHFKEIRPRYCNFGDSLIYGSGMIDCGATDQGLRVRLFESSRHGRMATPSVAWTQFEASFDDPRLGIVLGLGVEQLGLRDLDSASVVDMLLDGFARAATEGWWM